ncbi:MAG: NADH-quinone oxidoreductase subunit L [candidate division NC10 bacterium]|nr:NADH-quinone oxidoreductase subunit L [candidate division NC10 bacterium]
MLKLVWLVPILPLAGVVINGIFGRWVRERAHLLAVGTTGLSFLIALGIFLQVLTGRTLNWDVYSWIPVGDFHATVGFQADPLSAVMMLVVTFVGFLIHVYSVGYMHGDPGYARFFTYMNLFMSSMLILVLANNYLFMFLGWEGVGLCSYLLIGFWYQKQSASDAGKKAFVVNRIGDAGFLLGLFLIWRTFGSLHYAEIFPQVAELHEILAQPSIFGLSLVTWMTLLLFTGAVGKSAQLPLYVWLPDAMEGPTPVSALIHAATMVTAGVYMVARSSALFDAAPVSMTVVATVGALTAVFAATIALVQNDIKRVVAYSTISQLGYMFLGAGVGAYASAIFHLATHAFFKALLFLGSGSVIHGLGGEQDIRRMGGLRKHMPITAWTFLIAALANAGIFPLAGFWSKDQILHAAIASGHVWLWALGAAGAFGTAFYMLRLYFVTFEGESRVDPHVAHHVHESPRVMAVPLIILAVFAFGAGLFGTSPEHSPYYTFVNPVFRAAGEGAAHAGGEGAGHQGPSEFTMALVSVAIAAAGIALAYQMYLRRRELADRMAERFRGAYTLLLNKYWVDEIYNAVFVDFGKWLCHRLWFVDAKGVDGAVNGTSWLTVFASHLSARFDFRGVDGLVNAIADVIQGGSQAFKRLQTGVIQNYLLAMAMGIFVIVSLYFFF